MLAGLGAAALVAPAAHAAALTDEQQIYADRAALLDPECMNYIAGESWTVTVPDGETWYALNAWGVLINDAGPWFYRNADAQAALCLPAGTTLAAGGASAYSILYYARPALVQQDARYSDPVSLYWSRINRLRKLKSQIAIARIAQGSSVSQVHFPQTTLPDFGEAIITGISVQDGCWVILLGPTNNGVANTINLMDEINDTTSVRFTAAPLLPITYGGVNGFTQFALGFGDNMAPDRPCTGTQTLPGTGALLYSVLPADW